MMMLKSAMEWSSRSIAPYRENYNHALKQFVGAHYSENGATDRVPVNMLEMATSIYVQQFVSAIPQVMCSTRYASYKPMAADFSIVMNYELRRMGIDRTLQEALVTALFAPFAVLKVGECSGPMVEFEGINHATGSTFVDLIDFDDFIIDMTAKRWESARYMGDRYRVPLSAVHSNEEFVAKYRKKVESVSRAARSDADDEQTEHASSIGRGEDSTDDGEIEPYTELWDIWLPAEGKIITMPASGEPYPLREIEWDGPDIGPYDRLTFQHVPGNIMGLPPVANWMDLHEMNNMIFNKMARQSQRQKTVYGVRAGQIKDGERTIQANDGDVIKMDGDGVNSMNFPGADASSMAMFLQGKDLFSYANGNLDLLGGLSPQSQTVGQDQMLSASASQRVVRMQNEVVGFTTRIIRSLAYYVWENPLADYDLDKPVPGFESVSVPIDFNYDRRLGKFPDYDIEIQPYSMQHQTPSMKLQSLTQAFGTFIAPYMEQMREQGISVNFEKTVRTVSQLANLPELDDLITFVEPAENPTPISQRSGVGKPAETKRTYERINRPGGTRAGRDAALTKSLMGGTINDSEAASLDGGIR